MSLGIITQQYSLNRNLYMCITTIQFLDIKDFNIIYIQYQ